MKKCLLPIVLGVLGLFAGCTFPDIPGLLQRINDSSNPLFYGPFSVFIWVFLFAIYFMPTIIAVVSRKSRMVTVLMINAFLGWTVVGWIIALVLARI